MLHCTHGCPVDGEIGMKYDGNRMEIGWKLRDRMEIDWK